MFNAMKQERDERGGIETYIVQMCDTSKQPSLINADIYYSGVRCKRRIDILLARYDDTIKIDFATLLNEN